MRGRKRTVRRRRAAKHSLGSIGSLDVRLASTVGDIRLAQRLRYAVFFEEMAAVPDMSARMRRRDEDRFDAICDHLLVEDRAPVACSASVGAGASASASAGQSSLWRARATRKPLIAGTYRVLRDDVARRKKCQFYTQNEYDVASLMAAKGADMRFMELGRSCVLPPYRNKRTVELLWQGLWSYVRQHKVDVMIGCASFVGTDPAAHAAALSFLYYHAAAPPEWQVRAHQHLHCPMSLLPREQIDMKRALRALPPLIKGYLRLGAFVGDGAVVDHQFGTTDVLIILPVSRIEPRYFTHFGAPDAPIAPGRTKLANKAVS